MTGPLTTVELVRYTRPFLPHLSQHGLERLLTRLRQAHILTGLHAVGSTLFWALPGQGVPADADRRVRHICVGLERRSGQDRRRADRAKVGSWWVGAEAAAFTATASKRWRE